MDIISFIEPISESDPVGPYLRWEQDYVDLEEARRSDEDLSNDEVWRRETKPADWGKVIELGTRILVEKSKDLQVVAYMIEAWAHLGGLAGITNGLELLLAVQNAFWDQAHPESGDPELRRGVYEFLDDSRLLPARIRSVALTRVKGMPQLTYSYMKYKEALDTDREWARTTDERRRSLLEGNLRGAEFDEASAQTPREFYVELTQSLRQCRTAVERVNENLGEKWKPTVPRERAPQLSEILTALEDVEKATKRLLAKKPAPETVAAPEPDDEPASNEQFDSASEEGPADLPEAQPARPRRTQRNASPPAELNSPDDALARIADAAHFLRRADPADPASYLVLRAMQAAGLYRGDDALASGDLPPPPTEARERLFQMSKTADGGEWAGLLDESEQAMGRSEGRGWLDPQFYSARALEALGHDGAARACRAILATWLRDHPQWPESQLRDGTPCASRMTKEWIERECEAMAPAAEPEPETHEVKFADLIPSGAGTSNSSDLAVGNAGPPDPWEEAQALCRAGRLQEAMSVMVEAGRHARAGRIRFLLTLQQAELCLAADRPGLALPILESLAQKIDELHLDQWEEGSLCARVLAHLFRCLRGRDDARAGAIYNRLCQLDAGAALLLGEIGSSGTSDVNLKNGMDPKKRSNPSLGKTDIMSS